MAAGLFARGAIRMAFRGDVLKQMVSAIQGADREALESAAIITYRNGPGLYTHSYAPELESEDIQRWLQHLRDHDALVEGPTTLWTYREYFLPQARSLIRMGGRVLLKRLVKETE